MKGPTEKHRKRMKIVIISQYTKYKILTNGSENG